jgi:hypothetical protein
LSLDGSLALNLDDLRRLVLGLTESGVNVFVKENLTFAGDNSPMLEVFAEFAGGLHRSMQHHLM